jgi:hypothetical protein
MSTRLIVRRARKRHWADCDSYHRIKVGEYYLEGASMPGDDLGYADYAGHPVRLRECRACAERYGRGHLFPTPSSPETPAPGDEAARPEPSRDGDTGSGRASTSP